VSVEKAKKINDRVSKEGPGQQGVTRLKYQSANTEVRRGGNLRRRASPPLRVAADPTCPNREPPAKPVESTTLSAFKAKKLSCQRDSRTSD